MAINEVIKNYTLGRGKLYFGQFRPGTQTPRGERYLGNSPELSFNATQEELAHYYSDGGIRTKDASVILQQDYAGSFILDDINMALKLTVEQRNRQVREMTAKMEEMTAEVQAMREQQRIDDAARQMAAEYQKLLPQHQQLLTAIFRADCCKSEVKVLNGIDTHHQSVP